MKILLFIFSFIFLSCEHKETKQKELELREPEIKEKESTFKQQDSSSNQNKHTTPQSTEITNSFERDIPKPLVPIVPASKVLPTWAEKEDIKGDYPLLGGLFVGALGKKPFKLVIENVDTKNKTLSGFSKTSTSETAFKGRYTMTIQEPSSTVADNVIDFKTWVFKVVLFEPSGINFTGVFQLTFNSTDAHGTDASGTWTSYDGQVFRGIKLVDTYIAQEQ
ncbi:MAG: hypothetical protein IPP81_19960 [Chitinophagaceae bacterium]|nr:hypothetical protein [Chitinophagaceae bacterium]